MDREHDIVFIGAGHNALTAAAYLAKAGLDVCLLEKESIAGGAVTTEEITLPGFKHDLGGTTHGLIQANPMLINDELELVSRFGLKYIYPEVQWSAIFPDDTVLLAYGDLDKTCESIAKFSQHDAEAYRRFVEMTTPMVGLLGGGMFAPPPSYGGLMAQLDSYPMGQELIRAMQMSAKDVVDEWFEDERTKTYCLKLCTEPMVAPEVAGSAVYLFLLVPFMHNHPSGIPEGGSGELTKALARAVEAYGGTIVLDAEVTGVDVEGGRATAARLASGERVVGRRAVVSSVDPRVLFADWVDEQHTTPEFRRKVSNIHDPNFAGMMQHIALNEAPKFKAGPDATKGLGIEPLPWLEDYRTIYDDLRYGRPPKHKAPLLVCQSLHDPSRAPEGKHVLYFWHYEPWSLKDGGPEAWDERKEEIADDVLEYLRSITTNMGPENILARKVVSPLDYARKNPNLYHGTVLGPGAFMYQFFGYRPMPELGQYRTPIEGLYLVGHATHPGGSIMGGGRAMVQNLMADLDIDFDDVVTGNLKSRS